MAGLAGAEAPGRPHSEAEDRRLTPMAAAVVAMVRLVATTMDTIAHIAGVIMEAPGALGTEAMEAIMAATWRGEVERDTLRLARVHFQAKITVITQEVEVTVWVNRRRHHREPRLVPERHPQGPHLSSDIDMRRCR